MTSHRRFGAPRGWRQQARQESQAEKTSQYHAICPWLAGTGRQAPESFQEGEADTLVESLLVGTQKTSEPAGLTATVKLKSEEPMEIKTRVV